MAQDWERARQIYAEARRLQPGEQQALLARVRAEDADLADAVDGLLLARHEVAPTMALDSTISPFDAARAHPRTVWATKTLVNGRYRVTGELGHGGMGVVYDCFDERLNRSVALKTVTLPREAPDEIPEAKTVRADDATRTADERAARVARVASAEARSLAGIQHPNVTTLYDFFTSDDGTPCIVLERLSGGTLGRFTRSGHTTIGTVADLLAQAAAGVQATHDAGYIHRDVKPANILVVPGATPRAVLADFGIAVSKVELRTNQHRRAGFAGTFAFASPEAFLDDAQWVGPPADIYSLGATAYEVLVGEAPYSMEIEGYDRLAWKAKKFAAAPPPATSLNARISPALSEVLDRDMMLEPRARFGSPTEFAEALRRAAAPDAATPLGFGPVAEDTALHRLGNTLIRIAGQAVATVARQGLPTVLSLPAPSQPPTPRLRQGPYRMKSEPLRVVPVFYATDRRPARRHLPLLPDPLYSARRNLEGLRYGVCRVVVPASDEHKKGRLEQPRFWKLQFRARPGRHFLIEVASELDPDDFFARVAFAADCGDKAMFVFVHGYNVNFVQAVLTTAQLAVDYKLPGAPVLFSWPSWGHFLLYPWDETNVDWASDHFEQFIRQLAERAGARTIHLIAHSMGNRALTRGLEMLAAGGGFQKRFQNVVCAAPDIDRDTFGTRAPNFLTSGQRFTLYASSKDRALWASKLFHRYQRAGDTRPEVLVVPGIDTIDCTAVSTDVFGLGHSGFREQRSIVTDIELLLCHGHEPLKRGISAAGKPPNQHYRFDP